MHFILLVFYIHRKLRIQANKKFKLILLVGLSAQVLFLKFIH